MSFLDIGDATEARPSYLKSCSFNENFSPAIGIFGANGIELRDNVVYRTVGSCKLLLWYAKRIFIIIINCSNVDPRV